MLTSSSGRSIASRGISRIPDDAPRDQCCRGPKDTHGEDIQPIYGYCVKGREGETTVVRSRQVAIPELFLPTARDDARYATRHDETLQAKTRCKHACKSSLSLHHGSSLAETYVLGFCKNGPIMYSTQQIQRGPSPEHKAKKYRPIPHLRPELCAITGQIR